jgi:hypothetical protein
MSVIVSMFYQETFFAILIPKAFFRFCRNPSWAVHRFRYFVVDDILPAKRYDFLLGGLVDLF